MGMPAGSIVPVKVVGDLLGQETVTTFWYRVRTIGLTVSVIQELDQLLNYFTTSVNAPYVPFKDIVPESWNGISCSAQQYTPVLSVARQVTLVPDVGSRGPTSSSNLAFTVSKGTNEGGRSQLGSWHLPGVAQGDQAQGFIADALMLAAGPFVSKSLNVLIDPVSSTIYEPIIVHRAEDPRATTGTLLTRTQARNTIRVMRRRTVGVGK